MAVVLRILALGFGALFGLSFIGAILPVGDSLAVFRVPLAVVFALCLIWTNWPRRVRWPLVALAMAAIVQIVAPRWMADNPGGQDLVLYQQNLLYKRIDSSAWLNEIATQKPDVITLQEVSNRNLALLDALRNDYPTQIVCSFETVGGVAVLSRFKTTDTPPICVEGSGFVAIQLETPHGPLWAASLHLHWPWPFGQAAQVEQLVPEISRMEGNAILGGDFNAVGWSHSVRRIARSINSKRVAHAGPSFHLPYIAMPVTIDHVLSNFGSAAAVSMPRHGSDHFGILARIGFDAD